MTPSLLIAGLALVIWIYLILFRGGFWLARERDDRNQPAPPADTDWPSLGVVIPARNEVAMLPRSLESLLGQNYPGKLFIVAVDDESSDGTGRVACMIASNARREVVVLRGEPLPAAWAGKVWTMHRASPMSRRLKIRPIIFC